MRENEAQKSGIFKVFYDTVKFKAWVVPSQDLQL